MASVIGIFMRAATGAPKCSADASICASRWRIVGGMRLFMLPCRRGAMSIVRIRMASVLCMRVRRIGRIVTMVGQRGWPVRVDMTRVCGITITRRMLRRRSSRRIGRGTRGNARRGWFGFGLVLLASA